MRPFAALLLGVAATGAGMYAYNTGFRLSGLALGQQAPPTAGAPLVDMAALTALSDRFELVARAVLPAVVSIEATKPATATNTGNVEDSGTGVIVASADGSGVVVVTNHHVIAGARADQIAINLADGRMLRPTQVFSDPETDIAILKVESGVSLTKADGSVGLPTAKFADSDRVRIGQWVLALGSPFGLSQTVTHGIISARERGQISINKTIRVKDFLQTDAAINPGSSGGPLVNLNGEIIGINTAVASQHGGNSGIAFSIPSNQVRRVAKQLQERGVVEHGYLGLELADRFEPADAMALGLDRARGARIKAVVPDSPAARADLRESDVILQLDTVAIRNDNHLINLVSMLPAGQKVRLQVWRAKKVIAIDAVVGDWQAAKKQLGK